MKKIIIVLVVIIGVFAIYITEESIRLNNVVGSKPLIVLSQTKCSPGCAEVGDDITLDYYGIGYKVSIKYYHSAEGNDVYNITGEEFRLFYKYLLWAWIE